MTEQKKMDSVLKASAFWFQITLFTRLPSWFLRKQILAEWRALEIQRLDSKKLVPETVKKKHKLLHTRSKPFVLFHGRYRAS